MIKLPPPQNPNFKIAHEIKKTPLAQDFEMLNMNDKLFLSHSGINRSQSLYFKDFESFRSVKELY